VCDYLELETLGPRVTLNLASKFSTQSGGRFWPKHLSLQTGRLSIVLEE